MLMWPFLNKLVDLSFHFINFFVVEEFSIVFDKPNILFIMREVKRIVTSMNAFVNCCYKR
jgi:hypothetical protein